MKVGGVTHWLWRAVAGHVPVLDILLQEHRDTEAARSVLMHLVETYDVPEVVHTVTRWSYRAALREGSVFHSVEHDQVISTARCTTLVEQSRRPSWLQERSQLGFTGRRRTQEFLNLHARVSNQYRQTPTTAPATIR